MNYIQYKVDNKNLFLVDMKKESSHVFSYLAEKGIEKYIKLNKKILIITNKKGYYSGIVCKDCWWIPKCSKCDINIAYHIISTWEFIWLCHICKSQYEYPSKCKNCGGYNLLNYWVGIQQIQDFISRKYRVDSKLIYSDSINSLSKIKKIVNKLQQFQVIIWTSILVSWINRKIYSPDLVIFQNADIGINIPDYTAVYKNFLFLYEGINNIASKNFIIQTYNIDYPHIKFLVKNDFKGFREYELQQRKQYGYPPYNQLAIILYKHEIEEKLFNKIHSLFSELEYLKQKYKFEKIELYTAPPLIYKIFWKYRYNIVLKWENVRQFLEIAYEKLNIWGRWFKIDWMPESIT